LPSWLGHFVSVELGLAPWHLRVDFDSGGSNRFSFWNSSEAFLFSNSITTRPQVHCFQRPVTVANFVVTSWKRMRANKVTTMERTDLTVGQETSKRIGLGELGPRTNYSQVLINSKQSMGRGAGRNNNPFFIISTPVPSHNKMSPNGFKFIG
jgi:hypothetical protein